MNPKWETIASYRNADKTFSPCTLELDLNSCRIRVHRVLHMGDKWFLSCYNLNINDEELTETNIELAKSEAVQVVKRHAEYIVNDTAYFLENT